MSCLPRVASSVFILFSLRALQSYHYPGHRIQAYPHTMYAHSPLPGEHSSHFYKRTLANLSTLAFAYPTGYPFNTWVECGKCRSMSCQRTLVPRWDLNRGPCDPQSGDISTRPGGLYSHYRRLFLSF